MNMNSYVTKSLTARVSSLNLPRYSFLPRTSSPGKLRLQAQGIRKKPDFCCAHLNIESVKGLGLTGCKPQREHSRLMIEAKAYEASRSDIAVHQLLNLQEEVAESESSVQKLKIGFHFATRWALNVVFNIYNKKVLNVFSYPWLTSTLSLAAGSAMMFATWATRVAEAPETDLHFWKALIPVAIAHTIGHVAATVSMSKVAVSFTHVIKSAEPAFIIAVSR